MLGKGPVALVQSVAHDEEGTFAEQYSTLRQLLRMVATRCRWEVFLLPLPLAEYMKDPHKRAAFLQRLESFVTCEIEKGRRVKNKNGIKGVSLADDSDGKLAVRTDDGSLAIWDIGTDKVRAIATDAEELPAGVLDDCNVALHGA